MCQEHFHKSFMLSADPSHGRPAPIRVSFADCDFRYDEYSDNAADSGPTVLLIGGTGSSRWTVMEGLDLMAYDAGVRLLAVDNFGMGGTDRVPIEHRATSYVDVVRELLEHLGIRHVALASHSAGVVYLLNVVLALRHVLHPTRPRVFMSGECSSAPSWTVDADVSNFRRKAPWILPCHSRSLWPAAARCVPTLLLAKSHWVTGHLYHACSRARRRVCRRKPRHRGSGIVAETSPLVDMPLRSEPSSATEARTHPEAPPSKAQSAAEGTPDAAVYDASDPVSDDRSSLHSPLSHKTSIVGSLRQYHGSAPSIVSTEEPADRTAVPPDPETPTTGTPTTTDRPESSSDDGDAITCMTVPPRLWDDGLAARWQCAEGLAGAGDETVFCLRRGRAASWGAFADLDDAVALLAVQERARRPPAAAGAEPCVTEKASPAATAVDATRGSSTPEELATPSMRSTAWSAGDGRLRIDVAFAGRDRLVGRDGQAWLRRLFAGAADWCDFRARTSERCGHNEVLWRDGNFPDFVWDVAEGWSDGGPPAAVHA